MTNENTLEKKSISGHYAETFHSDDVQTFSWLDLETTSVILPQFENQALELIDSFLGYRPDRSSTLPYEVSLRGLISSFRYGIITQDDYLRQGDGYAKLIRNEDLRYHACFEYPQALYDKYWHTFDIFGSQARDRITFALGHEAELKHSIGAELFLRDLMICDTFVLPKTVTPIDFKILTIIRYREVLLDEGKYAADISPLPHHKIYSCQDELHTNFM